jgi:predicted nucleic acid-binding protein
MKVILDTNVFVSGVMVITTGDKALLRTSGYAGIEVLTPRAFVAKYLSCP